MSPIAHTGASALVSNLETVGEHDASLRGADHPSLDLGFGQVDVGDACLRVHTVAAQEHGVDAERLQHRPCQRIDQRMLLGPHVPPVTTMGKRGYAASQAKAMVMPLVMTVTSVRSERATSAAAKAAAVVPTSTRMDSPDDTSIAAAPAIAVFRRRVGRRPPRTNAPLGIGSPASRRHARETPVAALPAPNSPLLTSTSSTWSAARQSWSRLPDW